MVKLYERSVAELMIEATAQAEYPTSRGDLVAWFAEHYPQVMASTVRPNITGLTPNDRTATTTPGSQSANRSLRGARTDH